MLFARPCLGPETSSSHVRDVLLKNIYVYENYGNTPTTVSSYSYRPTGPMLLIQETQISIPPSSQ